jgi:hypothetical protein
VNSLARKTRLIKIDVQNEKSKSIISSTKFSIEENRLILQGDNFAVIDHGKKVNLVAYYEDGITFMEGIVTLSVEKQINIDLLDAGEKTDRRLYIKVKSSDNAIVLRAHALYDDSRTYNVKSKVRLRDISLGGICFYSNKVFLVNQKVVLNLNSIREDLVVTAQVLRKEKERTPINYKYRYGCKFLPLNNEQQRLICEYVFRLELENYHNELAKDMKIYDE